MSSAVAVTSIVGSATGIGCGLVAGGSTGRSITTASGVTATVGSADGTGSTSAAGGREVLPPLTSGTGSTSVATGYMLEI